MFARVYRIIGALLILAVPSALPALEIDETLSRLDLSGFMRFRAWYTGSETKVPGKFPGDGGYSSVDYQDMFLRGRFHLKALPNVEIRTVFDIVSTFGKDDFSLGNGGTNLVTRNAYVVFSPDSDSEISIGLQPFSLPGGYILARDATGIHASRHFFNRGLKAYCSLIKAFDDADSGYGDQYAPPRYADDNIYILGAVFSFPPSISVEAYYTFEHDRYTTDDDGRQATLHWAGIHAKLTAGNWTLRAGAIGNAGTIRLRETSGDFKNTSISAWLGEGEITWRRGAFQLGVLSEGASGDPDNPDAGSSFQDIQSSHEFSNIVVDNYGGLALRASGESCWYGLYGAGARLQYVLMSAVLIQAKLLHFRTTRVMEWEGRTSRWLGNELDFRAEYTFQEAVSIFFTAGFFLPQAAYSALASVRDDDGAVIECMLGMQITF
jgi:hypothetical protein